MARERFSADDPHEWINRARSNLKQAAMRHPDVYLEDLCFQAQQAAEKSLKGVLLHAGQRFPYTHDISRLMTIVDDAGICIPEGLEESVILSQYAVATRYPGVVEEVTESDYAEAMELASDIVAWAERLVISSK